MTYASKLYRLSVEYTFTTRIVFTTFPHYIHFYACSEPRRWILRRRPVAPKSLFGKSEG
jgi:hypothetical protein